MELRPKDFVRVNVRSFCRQLLKQDEGGDPEEEEHHFSIDPDTITLERLRHLMARALDVRGDFTVSLLTSGKEGRGGVPLSCDWDLEALLSEGTCSVNLALVPKPQEPGLEEWDVVCAADVPVDGHEASRVPGRNSACSRKLNFLEQVFRLHPVTSRPALSESEFRSLADWPGPLRHALYRCGGAESRLRPRLWLHLLDVYPARCGSRDREAFLNRRAEEYYALRHRWKATELEQDRNPTTDTGAVLLRDVTWLVSKDVRRTDRPLDLDERALHNILTTYALHHPSTGYRQGMGDLLSPLLRVMRTEALAYVAFCGLMRRMRDNFRPDGRSMRLKFRHLRRLLRLRDPVLHEHLRSAGALGLPFCYRWLLLDLKREFPYAEMLTMTEVLWSTLQPLPALEEGVAMSEDTVLLLLRNTKGRRIALSSGSSPEDGESTSDEEDGEDEPARRRGLKKRSKRRRSSSSSEAASSEVDSNYGSDVSREEDDENPHSGGRSEGYTSGQDSTTLTVPTTDEEEDYEEDRRILLPSPSRLGDGKPFLLFMCLALLAKERDAILDRGMDAAEIGIHFDGMVRRHSLGEVMSEARQGFEEYLRAGWTEDE